MAEEELPITLRRIEPGDRFTGFSLGEERYTPLKTFLQKKAREFHEQHVARTYGVFLSAPNSKIIGYVTLVCGEIATPGVGLVLNGGINYGYKSYPAVKIARLAVDHRYKRRSLGKLLVDFSLGVAKAQICPAVGCRFVVVDAKGDAVAFYEKCGFTFLDTEDNRARAEPVMFIDLLKAAIAAAD